MATIKSRSTVKIVKRESEDRQGDFKFLESLIRYHILCVCVVCVGRWVGADAQA